MGWQTFLNCWTTCRFTKWWTSPHPCFEDVPFIPSHDAIACYQWTGLLAEAFKEVFSFLIIFLIILLFLTYVWCSMSLFSMSDCQNQNNNYHIIPHLSLSFSGLNQAPTLSAPQQWNEMFHYYSWMQKAFSKVQLLPYIVKPSRLIESPVLMLWSSLRSCSHFKQALKPCYMYDARWVCSRVFRFIIKGMKRYLCESKLIQMCTGVSCRLCLSLHEFKFDLRDFISQ